jgi:hypothetical protein
VLPADAVGQVVVMAEQDVVARQTLEVREQRPSLRGRLRVREPRLRVRNRSAAGEREEESEDERLQPSIP